MWFNMDGPSSVTFKSQSNKVQAKHSFAIKYHLSPLMAALLSMKLTSAEQLYRMNSCRAAQTGCGTSFTSL